MCIFFQIKAFNDSNAMEEADQERNDMYSLASDLNAYLENMETQLTNTVDEFNESRGGSGDGAYGYLTGNSGDSSPLEQIIQVLNNHHDSLTSLDNQSSELKRKLDRLQREMGWNSTTASASGGSGVSSSGGGIMSYRQ